jgi:hypothetical protein
MVNAAILSLYMFTTECAGESTMTEGAGTGLAHEDARSRWSLLFLLPSFAQHVPPTTTRLYNLLLQKCSSNWVAGRLLHPRKCWLLAPSPRRRGNACARRPACRDSRPRYHR